MHSVALYLQRAAVDPAKLDDRDDFGRSAFNRYYYSLFLEVRRTLGIINPDWIEIKHKNAPETLRGRVKRAIQAASRDARKIGDRELIARCERARSLTEELARTLERAKSVRETADYHPETPVTFPEGERFFLSGTSITAAHAWKDLAQQWSNEVRLVIESVNP